MLEEKKSNIQEYMSIRSEMIGRIGAINSQSHTAILTIITVFAAGLSLKYDFPEKISNSGNGYNYYLIAFNVLDH